MGITLLTENYWSTVVSLVPPFSIVRVSNIGCKLHYTEKYEDELDVCIHSKYIRMQYHLWHWLNSLIINQIDLLHSSQLNSALAEKPQETLIVLARVSW